MKTDKLPKGSTLITPPEPKTVYLVTEGEYSDYRVKAVFSIKELAEAYIANHEGGVEEYEMDTEFAVYPKDRQPYKIRLMKSGRILYAQERSWDDYVTEHNTYTVRLSIWGRPNKEPEMFTNCEARDKLHAMKIAAERWQFFAAHDELWPTNEKRERDFLLREGNWVESET